MGPIANLIRLPFARAHESSALAGTQDVTAGSLEAERSLALAQSLVLHCEDAIVTRNLDGLVTTWNPAATRIFGWRPEAMIGHSILDIIPHRLHMEERSMMCRLLAGEAVQQLETTRLTSDGREIDVRMSLSPLKDARGKVLGITKIARNITEERIAERARLQLAAIVESSDDAIISKNLDGMITSWNEAAERMFGWKAADIIGQSILTLIPLSLQNEEPAIISDLLAGRRIDHYETTRVHRDGTLVPVSLSISPVRSRDGNIIGAAKIIRDNSRRRNLQSSVTQAHRAASGLRDALKSGSRLEQPLSTLAKLLERTRDCSDQWDVVRALTMQADDQLRLLAEIATETSAHTRQAEVETQLALTRISASFQASMV